ncbi:MAG: DnaJ C-terminal domain-containing protein [Caulobacter sp.]|nr:DnaJ C-terminal domain-containing protein [Caulobacter sp.]
MTARLAHARLGVGPGADEHALRAAFREAAKRNHPDRPGGDPAAFREIMDAYRFLKAARPEPLDHAPVPAAPLPRKAELEIPPEVAVLGGLALVEVADGRRLRVALPPGMRPGDQVRAGGESFAVVVRGDGAIVRGDDLWITARVDPAILTDGGRVAVATPRGERTVWVSRKAGARALVRLPGEGLPPREDHRQGDLFVRLAAGSARAESPARTLLRQFAAAWAA